MKGRSALVAAATGGFVAGLLAGVVWFRLTATKSDQVELAPAASRRLELNLRPSTPESREKMIADLEQSYARSLGRRPRIEIFIGEDAKPGEFKLAAAMLRKPGEWPECGGALVRDPNAVIGGAAQWVMTARHCAPTAGSRFAFGAVDLGDRPSGVAFDRVCLHPTADAALVRLKDVRLQASAVVLKPVSLQAGSPIEILGWGDTYRKETTVLQHAALTYERAWSCGAAECFSARSSEKATVCKGDSGSPALTGWTPEQPDEVIAGIATTISSCGGNPSQFVATTPLIPWIEKTMRDPSSCKVI